MGFLCSLKVVDFSVVFFLFVSFISLSLSHSFFLSFSLSFLILKSFRHLGQ